MEQVKNNVPKPIESENNMFEESKKEIQRLKLKVNRLIEEKGELESHLTGLKQQIFSLDQQMFDLFTLSQVSRALSGLQEFERIADLLVAMVAEKITASTCGMFILESVSINRAIPAELGVNADLENNTDSEKASFKEKKFIESVASNIFELKAVKNLDDSLVNNLKFHPDEGLFWQILYNGHPFSVLDADGGYRFDKVFRRFKLATLKSEIWVPLKMKDRILGILTLGQKEDGSSYKVRELEFLGVLANQAAVALSSAFLYYQTEQTGKKLDRQMFNLSILYNLGQSMNFINDLKKLLRLILEKAIEVINAQKGSLMLLDKQTNELVIRVVRGIPDKEVEEKINTGEIECTRIKYGEGIAGRVVSTKEYMIVNDSKTDGRFKQSAQSRVDSILCVPLVCGEEAIGVINVTNKKSGDVFVEDDAKMMITLAGQAAAAINNAQLYELAITDGMTKLFIHRYFQQKMSEEILRSKRNHKKFAMLMTDIDHFKPFNDTYGHQIGDLVLVETAKIIKKMARETDIVCRYGGEEFTVICPDTDHIGAYKLAERIRKAVEAHRVDTNSPHGILTVNISVGISVYPDDASDKVMMIKGADDALYVSKEGGRNRCSLATKDESILNKILKPADQKKEEPIKEEVLENKISEVVS